MNDIYDNVEIKPANLNDWLNSLPDKATIEVRVLGGESVKSRMLYCEETNEMYYLSESFEK